MEYVKNGRFCNLLKRIMKFTGLDDMRFEFSQDTGMCRLVLCKDCESIMGGKYFHVNTVHDTEVIFKEFIDDWFIGSNRSTLRMATIKGCSKNYLISDNYSELEMKLTIGGV